METAVPHRTLRILVADDDQSYRHQYGRILVQLGHEVVGIAEDGESLAALFRELNPDMVVADVNMPLRDGITATQQIWRLRPLPILLISGNYDAQLLERTQMEHVMAYLAKPVSPHDLRRGIELALRRFEQFELVRNQAKNAQSTAPDWNSVCQAKQLLLKSHHQDEEAVFDRLLELARTANQNVAQAAQTVIAAYHLTEK